MRRLLGLAGLALAACHEAPREPFALNVPPAVPSLAATAIPLRVLLLADVDIPGTDALNAALVAAGFQVTRRPAPEYTWDGTNPSLVAFDAVVHLDGFTYFAGLPPSGQTALVAFVNAGGHYITDMYTQYEVRTTGTEPLMLDLALHQWGGGVQSDNCLNCVVTYTADPLRIRHPVLAGIPASFSFQADGHDAGPLVVFATRPAVVLMRAPRGGPAVTVRHLGLGCVTNFSIAPNQAQSVGFTLQDPNIQRLYINAVAWDCNADVIPPTISMTIKPTVLWPADKELVRVAKGIKAVDDMDPKPSLVVTVTFQDAGESRKLSRDDPDWRIVTNLDGSVDVWVRAERSPKGNGRTYTITATARDESGNVAVQTGTVLVPKDGKGINDQRNDDGGNDHKGGGQEGH